MKQTLKEAGYEYIRFNDGQHILKDIVTGHLEVFVANKNFNGWGIIYKNTHLEFCYSL